MIFRKGGKEVREGWKIGKGCQGGREGRGLSRRKDGETVVRKAGKEKKVGGKGGKVGKEKGKVVTKDVKGKGCQVGREGGKVCQERREGERCCQEGSERVVRKGGKGNGMQGR